MSNLENSICDICGRNIRIIMTSPSSVEDKKMSSGMYLFVMDDGFNEEHFQDICNFCAQDLCDEGKITIGFDGDSFDGLAQRSYFLDERSQLRKGRLKTSMLEK